MFASADEPPGVPAPARVPVHEAEGGMGDPDWVFDQRFDGGQTGCGEILVDLKLFFRPLPSGSRVLIIARDGGAPLEMPAWCRMAGHRLQRAEHPFYLVEKL